MSEEFVNNEENNENVNNEFENKDDQETQEVSDNLRKKTKHKKLINTGETLSTGSALLNLAITGKVNGGFPKGKYFWMVGDSDSGKTFFSLTCFAEAAKNPEFSNYRFIYDNAEDGALMDMTKYFGATAAAKIEPPRAENGIPIYSSTVEEFYYHVDDAINEGKPFIYVLDSMDALSSEQELAKFQERKNAHMKGKEPKGEMTDNKAKRNSGGIRQLIPKIRDSNSILIIISQTRDNMGWGFEEQTTSGGRALKFYATAQIWTKHIKKLVKNYKDKDREIGIAVKIDVKKNRITGRKRSVVVPIHHSHGIDDVGSCIKFLIEEKYWPGSDKKVKAKEFDFDGSIEKLVEQIQSSNSTDTLYMLVQMVWNEIEDACVVKRKTRYE